MLARALHLARDISTHPITRKRPFKTVASLLGWQLAKRLKKSPQQRLFWNMRMNCYADSHAASALVYYDGYPEYRSMSFLEQFLQPGDAVMDIGANVGMYSLFMASIVGETGRVDAFEPSPTPRTRLGENIALNNANSIHTHAFAIGAISQTVNLKTSIDGSAGFVSASVSSDSINVEQRKLSDLVSNDTNYIFAKIDTEGAELEVLKGATEFIQNKNPPVWQLELDGLCQRFEVQSSDIVDWLAERGFRIALFWPDDNALQMTLQPWLHMDWEKNVLAISDEGKELIQKRMPDTSWH